MRVELLSIGYELLIGKVVNTNASWLAAEITKRGHTVQRIVCVGDNEQQIVSEVKRALEGEAQGIITTGGLGPTFDDITAQAVAKALGKNLVKNSEAYSMVSKKYQSMGLPLTPEREKMAFLPEDSTVLENPVGTAPAFVANRGDKWVMCLPGVPEEMKAIFLRYAERFLPTEGELFEEVVAVSGIPESTLAPIIAEFAKKNPYVYIKSHPKGHESASTIEVHIYTVSSNPHVKRLCSGLAEKLRAELQRIGGHTVS